MMSHHLLTVAGRPSDNDIRPGIRRSSRHWVGIMCEVTKSCNVNATTRLLEISMLGHPNIWMNGIDATAQPITVTPYFKEKSAIEVPLYWRLLEWAGFKQTIIVKLTKKAEFLTFAKRCTVYLGRSGGLVGNAFGFGPWRNSCQPFGLCRSWSIESLT